MKLAYILLIILCSAPPAISRHIPVTNGKITERVIVKYEKLIAQGAALTPEGWQRLMRFYETAGPYPSTGPIFLMSPAGLVGENWNKENHAEVETKWGDYLGSLSSDLKYSRPSPELDMSSVMMGRRYRLHFTNEHAYVDAHGKLVRKTVGFWEWKIEGPLRDRWATLNTAIAYLKSIRDSTHDPSLKKRVANTIRILQRLSPGCGNASAC